MEKTARRGQPGAAIRMSANAVRFVRQNFSRERFLNSIRSLMENVK